MGKGRGVKRRDGEDWKRKVGKGKERRRLVRGICSFAVFSPKWNVCARRRRGVFFTDDLFLGTVEVTVWKKFEAGGGGGGLGPELRGIGENGFDDS